MPAAGRRQLVCSRISTTRGGATFGEIMASTYKAFGCVGLITSGAGRDLDQCEPLKFPCFHVGHDLFARLHEIVNWSAGCVSAACG